ncbi:hypothetical protein D3C81_1853670 [compost metagenome]
MIDAAEPAALYEALGQLNRWREAVIETDHMPDTRRFSCFQHLPGISQIQREWLLAEDMLARLCGRQGNFLMGIARRIDIHKINILTGN